MKLGGGEASFPPLQPASEWLVVKLQALGLCSNVGMGRFPLSPERIEAWSRGTVTELTPKDFEDLLGLSAVYCAACSEYDKHNVLPPWQPELTEVEEVAHDKAIERAMDIAMGVS